MGYKSGELEWNLAFMGSIAAAYLLLRKTQAYQDVARLQATDITLY